MIEQSNLLFGQKELNINGIERAKDRRKQYYFPKLTRNKIEKIQNDAHGDIDDNSEEIG